MVSRDVGAVAPPPLSRGVEAVEKPQKSTTTPYNLI